MGNSCGGLDDYWDAIRAHRGLAGRLRVGLGRPGARAEARRRNRAARVRRRLRRRAQRRRVRVRRARRRRPHAASVAARARQGDPAGADSRDRRGRPACSRSRTSTRSSISRGCSRVVRARRRRRRSRPASSSRSRSRPGRRPTWTIPLPALELTAGQRAHLTLSFRTRADLPWAPAGHEVAWEQFEIGAGPDASHAPGPAPADAEDARVAGADDHAVARADRQRDVRARPRARWERLGLRDAARARRHDAPRSTDGDAGGTRRHARRRGSRRARRHPPRRCAPPARSGRAHRRVARRRVRTSATPIGARARGSAGGSRRSTTGRFPTCTRRRAATAPACAGCASSTTPASRCSPSTSSTTSTSPSPASPTRSSPRPTTSRSCRRDDCYVWIDVRQRGVGSAACGPDTAAAHRIGPGHYRWSYRLR